MTRVIQLPSVAAETFGAGRENAHRSEVGPAAPAIRTDAVYVVYTTVDDSLTAARAAVSFADALGVPVTVVHFRTVPYALPLEALSGNSPIETEEFAERLRAERLDVKLRVYLCRDERPAIPFAFKSPSLIVVGGRRHWWPTHSDKMRRMIHAAGHFVVFVDTAKASAAGAHRTHNASSIPAATKETSHA